MLRGLLHPVYIKSVSTYQTSFSSEQVVKKEVLEIVSDSASTEKELVEEAVNLKQEKRQEVAILTYYDSVQEPDLKKELNYKAETTDEGVKITNFYHNANTVSDTALSKQWDVSQNNFDLVTGVLTIQLTIEEGLGVDTILTQSKGLIDLLMTYNAEKEIQAIELEIKSGKEQYSFKSVTADTLTNTKMVYTN
ncbi:hypothetical protein LHA31_11245 [Carnobacterium viridans]|uniref:hypothetical protein n=1 Tax=Carnobacterium viridans TaxID=174587 RepID=UPI001D0003A5|nr:hypothetical protein [Carnobacterium viridans]UDE95106.1 hypothetical protein LHA31_11245 [Carnobacterium viridans]